MKILAQFLFFFAVSISAQTLSDSLTESIKQVVQESTIPGVSVSIVTQDDILYSNGFGYADKEASQGFTKDTKLNIGSITKTLIAVSLMQLVEEGKVSLNDDINTYLPFKVVNPYFPEEKISLLNLATHTASLTDGDEDMLIEKTYLFEGAINYTEEQLPAEYYPYFQIYQTNQRYSMESFLKNVYNPKGLWYEDANFIQSKPGEVYQYTNLGATLLAFIIEQVTSTSFAAYTQKNILDPLKMKETHWKVTDAKENMAAHYLSNGLKIPKYELITYPDGGLITSVEDFSKYLMEMIKGLDGEGSVLSKSGFKTMMSNQLTVDNFKNSKFESSKGLMWNVNSEGDNISMNGSDPGILTYTLFTTSGNIGIVIFMNTNIDDNEKIEEGFYKIRGLLMQHAGKLLSQNKK